MRHTKTCHDGHLLTECSIGRKKERKKERKKGGGGGGGGNEIYTGGLLKFSRLIYCGHGLFTLKVR